MTRRTRRESTKPSSDLPSLLKFLRRRVDPDVRDLGTYARLPSRLGKPVTQTELAEATGVSREWYARLECGVATTRASTGLLDRLADALMVTPAERAHLFHVAVPELGRVSLQDDSIAVLAAFSRLTSFTKRLLTATSVGDVLTTASEQIADWFDRPLLVLTSRRSESGLWEFQAVDDKDRNQAWNAIKEAAKHPSESEEDGLNLYPWLANAGDVGTSELYSLSTQRKVLEAYARRRLAGFAFAKTRVRSRTGLIAGLSTWHETGHSYSPSDRAVLGAFGELASLALS
jgi:transcriptional regulator with XRE-family HTH domain